MAHPSSQNLSYLGLMSTGAIIDGVGVQPATRGITNETAGVAGGILQNVTSSRLKAKERNVSTAVQASLDTLGERDIQGYGAFVNSVPSLYTSLVGTASGLDRINAHGELMFGSNPIHMTQTFSIASSFVATSAQMAPVIESSNSGVYFGKQPGIDKLEYPENGIFPNYLGDSYKNMQEVATNGVSTLVSPVTAENIQLLASDIVNLGGAFDVADISNFGNPGQVVAGLYGVDGLTLTGVGLLLEKLQVNPDVIYNLSDSNYNEIMTAVLKSITIPELIANAQNLLNTNVGNMTSLHDYLDIDKVFPNSRGVINFTTFDELKEKLSEMELGNIQTLAQFAEYINNITPVELPTIDNTTKFIYQNYIDTASNKFVGGTGPNGRITIGDMIGSLGGVGISVAARDYRTAINSLNTSGELTDLSARISQLLAGLNGDYTTGTTPNFTIADPNGITHGPDTEEIVYTSFVSSKIGQIETELANIMSRANVVSDIDLAINNWLTMYEKINKEKQFQSRIDMNYAIRTNFADLAYSFIVILKGTINEPGKKSIVTGMIDQAVSSGDIGGEYLRAYMKELENRSVGDIYDVRWRAELH